MPLLRTWDDLHPQPYVVLWNGTLARQAALQGQRAAPQVITPRTVRYRCPAAVRAVLEAHPEGVTARELVELTGAVPVRMYNLLHRLTLSGLVSAATVANPVTGSGYRSTVRVYRWITGASPSGPVRPSGPARIVARA